MTLWLWEFKSPPRYHEFLFGLIAQLVERYIRIVEVGGSNPLESTNKKPVLVTDSCLLLCCFKKIFRLWRFVFRSKPWVKFFIKVDTW